MTEETKVDWSKAPEDATHCHLGGLCYMWYKLDRGNWYYWNPRCKEWCVSGNSSEYTLRYIPKPNIVTCFVLEVKPTKPEWKIRHIKSPNYTPKKDGAITILYKDVGDGYIKYKIAYLNPEDNFDRKVGVATAKSKKSRKVYVGKNDTTSDVITRILIHTGLSEYLSKDTHKVVDIWLVQNLAKEGIYLC